MKEDLHPDQKLNKPLSWKKPVAPLNERLGNQDFIDLCETVRFQLNEPTNLSRPDRLETLEEMAAKRAYALGNYLRIDPRITPNIAQILATCAARLRRPVPPETFIRNGAGELDARCYIVSPHDPQFLFISGELVDLMDEAELLFVLGHEMGHMALHSCKSNPRKSENNYFTRAMEISADRVGLLACLDPMSAFKGLIKVSTSLNAKQLSIDIDALIQQGSEISRKHDGWQSDQDHPFLPFRIWALQRFSETDRFKKHVGESGGLKFDEVEQEIVDRFEMIGGGTIHVHRADRLNESLIWLSTLLIAELPNVSSRARLELEHLIGRIRAEQALDQLNKGGKEEIKVRAEIWTGEVISAQPKNSVEIKNDLEILAAAIGIDLKTTEAWVVLAEAIAKNTTSDNGDD